MSTALINPNTSLTNDTLGATVFKSIATLATTALLGLVNRTKCYNITVKCSKPMRLNNQQRFVKTTLLLMNLSTTALTPTTHSNITRSINTTATTNSPEFITIPLSTMLPSTTYDTTTITTTTTAAASTEIFPTTTSEPSSISTTPKMTTTVAIPPLTISSIKNEERPTNLVNTTAIYNSEEESTIIDNENVSTTNDIDELPTTTTTMLPANNETFFDYYDYFAGLPVDMETVDSLDEVEEVEELERSYKTTTTQTNLEPKNLVRKVRQVTSTTSNTLLPVVQLPFYVPAFRKSIYSRRKHDGFSTIRSIYGRGDNDSMLTTTTFPWNYMTRSTVLETTGTTNTDTTEIDSTTIMTTESTSVTETTETTTQPRENDTNDNTIIPYFIDDEEIIDIGVPTYYDSKDFNIEKYDICIRHICEELPQDSFTTSTASTIRTELSIGTNDNKIVINSLESLERHKIRLNKVQRTLREIQKNLTSMCWETTLGQELSKVIVFDGVSKNQNLHTY